MELLLLSYGDTKIFPMDFKETKPVSLEGFLLTLDTTPSVSNAQTQ